MNSAEKLKKLRKEKGITMVTLSKEIGIGVPAIAKYEDINNPRIPKHEILLKLAKYYNVDIEYLLNEEAENITTENIKINKILGLKDETIDLLKDLKLLTGGEEILDVTETLNDFLTQIELYDFLLKIKQLKCLYKYNNFIKELDEMIDKLSPVIEDNYRNDYIETLKIKNFESKIKKYYDDTIFITKYVKTTDINKIIISLKKINEFKSYDKLEKYCQKFCEEVGVLIDNHEKNKKLLRFEINEQFMLYLNGLLEER